MSSILDKDWIICESVTSEQAEKLYILLQFYGYEIHEDVKCHANLRICPWIYSHGHVINRTLPDRTYADDISKFMFDWNHRHRRQLSYAQVVHLLKYQLQKTEENDTN